MNHAGGGESFRPHSRIFISLPLKVPLAEQTRQRAAKPFR
jgi:hypothetical protein